MSANHIWYKSYPKQVPQTIDPKKYSSLVDVFDSAVAKYSDKPAFKNMDVEISFTQLGALADAFASYLQNETSLKKGDRIAIQMPNLLQFPVALFGALKAGLVVVNTNPLYTPTEMQHQFKDSGAKAIVILENFGANLQQILPQTDIELVITTKIGDLLGGLKGTIVNAVVKYIKKMVPPFSLPSAKSFKNILDSYKNKKPQSVNATLEDIAFLQYTGGTTGVSKGAILTHGNLCANLAQVDGWLAGLFEEGKEVVITALPLYHIFALTANCLVFVNYGAKNVLITNPRDMPKFMSDLKKNPFSFITGVNTLFNGMLNQPNFKEMDFSKLKVALGGGMAVQDVVANRWIETTNSPLLEAYGLSETSPAATINPTDGSNKIGSIGLPICSTEIILLDDDGNEVAKGERGEIAIKGPQVFQGYWEKPEATKIAFKNGYFLTGDIGTMDEDGFFRIVDRKKEMVCVSGFNVYPSEIEAVINSHPKVFEVGVKGVADEKTTEAVKAFIVPSDASLTEEEIITFCKEKLTSYKVPKHIAFREELPKSNVGKILRRLME